MITWKMNEWGNIEIWKGVINLQHLTHQPRADLFLRADIDVKAFLKNIGFSPDAVKPGQWGYAQVPNFMKHDPNEDDEDW